METVLKKALDQVKADEDLKRRTAEYVLNADSNVVPMRSASVRKKGQFYGKRLVAAACIAAVLCALPIGAYAYYTPTSYVSVDINPSVELGINTFGRVISVKAYNTDGETVISGLTLLNTKLESAVNLIVTSASQNGFIHDDGSSFISVTTETNNKTLAKELEQDAEAGAEDAIESEDSHATIVTDNIALERRDEAIALGITPGKLNLIQKLQVLDPAIKTEDYKDASVSEIQKKFVELKKEQKDIQNADTENTAASPDPSASPDASPSATSSPSEKPDNGNHNGNGNGNGNKNDDNSANSAAAPTEQETGPAITPSPDAKPDPKNGNSKDDNTNNDKNDNANNNSSNSWNSNHDKANGRMGKMKNYLLF